MSSRWARLARALALVAAAGMAIDEGSLACQQTREAGIQAIATASDPELVVAGLLGALRLSPRTRVSAFAGAGGAGREVAWRGEVLAGFLLNPMVRRGWGWYLSGGVAVVGGAVDRGYLVLAIGVEQDPGGRAGWVAEAGVGGGARLAAGYRWRWRK